MRAEPSTSSAADLSFQYLANAMLPVIVHSPVFGSYISALFKRGRHPPHTVLPPATRTIPDKTPWVSNVATCAVRAVLMLPVRAQDPVEGSNSSAVAVA